MLQVLRRCALAIRLYRSHSRYAAVDRSSQTVELFLIIGHHAADATSMQIPGDFGKNVA